MTRPSEPLPDPRPLLRTGAELEDTADLSAPISNSYAEHSVRDSPACRSLCAAQLNDPTPSLFRDKDATGCKLAAPPRFTQAPAPASTPCAQVYHSTMNDRPDVQAVCGCAMLPIKTTTRGPAPLAAEGARAPALKNRKRAARRARKKES